MYGRNLTHVYKNSHKGLSSDKHLKFNVLSTSKDGIHRTRVPAGSLSRGGDVLFDQPSLPTPFNSVLVSVSVFMALSTVFHS